MQCKGDIVVVDIKQHKSQFKKFKLYYYTVSKVLLTLCNCDEISGHSYNSAALPRSL